jgi:hypothetical protein
VRGAISGVIGIEAPIGVAIVWLALDNHFGVVDRTVVVTPTVPGGRAAPRLGTPQPIVGGSIDAVQRGTALQIGNRPAPRGSHYLVIAVQLTNTGRQTLHASPSAFAIRFSGRVQATGLGYPGHLAPFSSAGIGPGQRIAGDLAFVVPDSAGPLELLYAPNNASSTHIIWRVP